jgi:hypothetical protein
MTDLRYEPCDDGGNDHGDTITKPVCDDPSAAFHRWLDRQKKAAHPIDDWADERIVKFLRTKLLREGPILELSYCYAQLRDGTVARVLSVPGENTLGQLYAARWKSEAVEEAKRRKIFLKGRSFFESIEIM